MEKSRPFALCNPLPVDGGDQNRNEKAGDINSKANVRFVSGRLTELRMYDTNNHV